MNYDGIAASEDRAERSPGRRTVRTTAWKLEVPATVTQSSPLLVVPTVHPRGDRRIVRCAQVALDAGFRVHLMWLGEGEASVDEAVRETLFRAPRNAVERIRMVPLVAKRASRLDACLWHIHDFYFLRAAKRWHRASGRSVLYDVHEYYASYYARKLRAPGITRRWLSDAIERYQVRSTRKFGAADVVAEKMAESFRAQSVPVSVSPNYPVLSQFGGLPSVPFESRRWRVLHIGTLTRDYGTQLLVQLASRSAERELPFSFDAMTRFPSPDHEKAFELLLADAGNPPNLRLISTRPTHEMPALLASAGFGLSLLMPSGQNDLAVPSKNYEYVMAGMVNVVTSRPAQRRFVDENAVAVFADDDEVDALLDQMMRLATDSDATNALLIERAKAARELFAWERAVEPDLREMLLRLAGS